MLKISAPTGANLTALTGSELLALRRTLAVGEARERADVIETRISPRYDRVWPPPQSPRYVSCGVRKNKNFFDLPGVSQRLAAAVSLESHEDRLEWNTIWSEQVLPCPFLGDNAIDIVCLDEMRLDHLLLHQKAHFSQLATKCLDYYLELVTLKSMYSLRWPPQAACTEAAPKELHRDSKNTQLVPYKDSIHEEFTTPSSEAKYFANEVASSQKLSCLRRAKRGSPSVLGTAGTPPPARLDIICACRTLEDLYRS